jgi:hypothetical protein
MSGNVPFARLPAPHNWLLTGALPRVDADRQLVHPDFPYEPLGIIHRAANTKFSRHSLRDLDGRETGIGTEYRRRELTENRIGCGYVEEQTEIQAALGRLGTLEV